MVAFFWIVSLLNVKCVGSLCLSDMVAIGPCVIECIGDVTIKRWSFVGMNCFFSKVKIRSDTID